MVVALIIAGPAQAATFTVNSFSDSAVGPCSSTCTLRDAVVAADTAGGANTIDLSTGTYMLTIPAVTTGDHQDDPTTGDLDINSGVI